MNRRSFLAALAGAFAIDPERALWTPGAKLISIPPAIATPQSLLAPSLIAQEALKVLRDKLVFAKLELDALRYPHPAFWFEWCQPKQTTTPSRAAARVLGKVPERRILPQALRPKHAKPLKTQQTVRKPSALQTG